MSLHGLLGSKIGDYEITNRIGSGGMGAVYEGRHPVIGKRVCVKVLHAHLTSDEELMNRFVSEARAVNEIRHRGIVDIFAFGQLDDRSPYFIMELLEGDSFEAVLKKQGAVPLAQALPYFIEMVDAVGAAHDANIVHRDLKPSNIFLAKPPRGPAFVKVLDFGIAKLLTGHGVTRTKGDMLGTPQYMAPEQVTNKPVGPATDIYALGIVFFELLSAARPFMSESPLAILRMQVSDRAPRLSSVMNDVPEALDDLIARMLEKVPAERPQTCDEVLVVLRSLSAELASQQPAARRDDETNTGTSPKTDPRLPRPRPSSVTPVRVRSEPPLVPAPNIALEPTAGSTDLNPPVRRIAAGSEPEPESTQTNAPASETVIRPRPAARASAPAFTAVEDTRVSKPPTGETLPEEPTGGELKRPNAVEPEEPARETEQDSTVNQRPMAVRRNSDTKLEVTKTEPDKRPGPIESPAETQPDTVNDRPMAVRRPTESKVDVTKTEPDASRNAKVTLVVGLLAGVAALIGIGVWASNRTTPDRNLPVEQPLIKELPIVELKPTQEVDAGSIAVAVVTPTPAVDAGAEPKAEVDAGAVVAAAPVKPKPAEPKAPLTKAMLERRLKSVAAALQRREAKNGSKDQVFRTFLQQCETAVAGAKTPKELSQAAADITDLERQLR